LVDNLEVQVFQWVVKQTTGRVQLEVSGGISLNTIREFAETGVDYISVGALTHSAAALDLSLLVRNQGLNLNYL
ncbi:MAG: nicotinate-nucleotide diphosphorylase (carboxylating), partial [bacterium]